jgi:hypothetical protein
MPRRYQRAESVSTILFIAAELGAQILMSGECIVQVMRDEKDQLLKW